MANVGTAAAGKTLIGTGVLSQATFAEIGTSSGLTANGVVIAEGAGAFQATSAGSVGQVLMSNGAGVNPSFQSGGTSIGQTITGDNLVPLSPTSGNWNLFGTANQITTTGAGSTLTYSVPAVFIAPGSIASTTTITAATGLTVTDGNAAISSGNITLANTDSGLTQGLITWTSGTRIHNFGTNNVFFGASAGNGTLTVGNATNNVGIGTSVLNGLTTGVSNVIVGSLAATSLNSGNENVVIGRSAGAGLSGGGQNVIIGHNAATSFTSGSSNVIIGQGTATNYAAGCNSNIIIGPGIAGVAAEDNKIRIGQSGSGTGQQNACYIAGIYGVSVASSLPVTIDTNGQLGTSAGGGFVWVEVTGTSQNAAVGFGYIANNAGLVTITLPANFAVGDVIRVAGLGAGLWTLVANTGDVINFGSSPTSAGGSLTATNRYDCVEVLGVATNTTWVVLSSVGNLTVA